MNKNHIKRSVSLFFICVVLASALTEEFDEDIVITNEQQTAIVEKSQATNLRCTRRFTPGACLGPISSVWTFEFQIQNCTERLGCPTSRRTNRFRSYGICMKRCNSLIELYMQVLAYEGNNNSLILFNENEGPPVRRGGYDTAPISNPPSEEEYMYEYSGDEAINTLMMYGNSRPKEDDDGTELTDIVDENFMILGDYF